MLSTDFKKFASMHCTYSIFQAMVSFYITTLLMRVTGNGDIVIWFNLATYFFQGFGVIFCVVVMRKSSVNLAMRIGILGLIVMYAILLFFMDSADKLMPVLGFFNGVANGFYWLAYASYFSAFTVDSKRDAALGFMGFMNGITFLIMPTLSGFVIEKIGGFAGYTVVFGLAFLIALITIFLSLRLPKQVCQAEENKTYFYRLSK